MCLFCLLIQDAMLTANASMSFQRQLRNQQQQDVNAAIVEIDKAADGSPYPNQLGMFETLSPEEL